MRCAVRFAFFEALWRPYEGKDVEQSLANLRATAVLVTLVSARKVSGRGRGKVAASRTQQGCGMA